MSERVGAGVGPEASIEPPSESGGDGEGETADNKSTEEAIQELREVVEDAVRKSDHAQDQILKLREENAILSDRVDTAEQERDELRKEVSRLRERTDLLETVRRAGSMGVEERAAVLVQTLYNEARGRGQKNTKDTASAMMDYNKAEGALGGGVSRDQIYRTFDRAEELVDDTDVVQYIKEDRTSPQNSRLVLTLENGALPQTIAGHAIEEPGV